MRGKALVAFLILSILLGFDGHVQRAYAQDIEIPSFTFIQPAKNPQQVVSTLEIILVMTVLSIAPAILLMTTCFTRIVVVLSFLRQALTLQQLPPNQVMIGLALFLTFMIMGPTWGNIYDEAVSPYMDGSIGINEAMTRSNQHMRHFIWNQIEAGDRLKDVQLFCGIAGIKNVKTRADVPSWVLIPAYMLGELKISFEIGFLLFLPFLVIDMVVASVLMSMGMMMLPPVMISLPFKVLLFVLVDGWHLVVTEMVRGIPPI